MAEMSTVKLGAMRALAEDYARSRDWTIEDTLGSGGSAAVFLAETPMEKKALKVYDPTFFQEENGQAERHRLELQQRLVGHDCPSLVSIEAIDFDLDTCFMSMEYLPWYELSKCLDAIPREQLWTLISQLVSAVRFLEDAGLVHRDIKPHNIMVSKDYASLRLIDLGVIREIEDGGDRPDGTDQGHRRPFLATAQYSSPEYLFRLREPSPELWKGLTFYQIGAVIHDLITRKSLFDDEVATANRYAVAMAVLSKAPAIPADPTAPLELRRLATYCLTKDLDLRLKLVRWADFEQPGNDEEALLARRFEQRTGGQRGQVALIEEQRRLALQREQTTELLLRALEGELKAGATASMHPERITFKAQDDRGMFRFHVPGSTLVIDASIEFAWVEQESPLVAAVSLACTLKQKEAQTEWMAPSVIAGRLGPGEDEIGLLAASLRKRLIRAATRALNEIENGFETEVGTPKNLSVE